MVDEVKIFSKALTEAEINNIYQSMHQNSNIIGNNLLTLPINFNDNPTYYFDHSGYNNHATCLTSYCPNFLASGVSSTVGGSLQFDGQDQRLNIPNSNSLNPGSEITLSAWIKPNTSASDENWQIIISKWNIKNNICGS